MRSGYWTGNETGTLDPENRRRGETCLKPTCFPCRSGLWVIMKCLLDLGAEIKQQVSRGSLWALWDPQEMATGGQRRMSKEFHCKARNKPGELGWEKRGEEIVVKIFS